MAKYGPGRKLTFSLSIPPEKRVFLQSVQDRLGQMMTWDEKGARRLDTRLACGMLSYEDVDRILEGGQE